MLWQPHTVAQALEKCVNFRGNELALIVQSKKMNWSEVQDRAILFAKSLLAFGVHAGDFVGILCANDDNWIDAFLGSALIGAVTVPLNTRFKSTELLYCLKDADVKFLFTMDQFLNIDFIELLQTVEPQLNHSLPGSALPMLKYVMVWGDNIPSGAMTAQEFLSKSKLTSEKAFENACLAVNPLDVLLIQFTSGTTAFPKGVMLTHENMLHNANAVADRIGLTSEDRYFNCRPFFHVAGSTLSLLATIETQSCLVTLPTFEAGAALRMIYDESCTFISGNDTIFQLLLNHVDFDASKLKLRGGWAAAGPQTMHRIVHEMGIKGICWSYGLSEASPNVVKSDFKDCVEDRIDGLAKPLPGLEVKIIDQYNGLLLNPFQHGEICVRGWSVMKGYYKKPELSAQAIDSEGWLHTGDLGFLTYEGHLRFVGRIKDIFRVGGENVAPAEVEESLLSLPVIATAQVVGVPDAKYGEVGAAYISLKEGTNFNEEAVVGELKKKIANFKVPKYFAVVSNFETIGMTASGKVQKNKLKEDALRRFSIH
jgi:fatty-acyl-CoA synthase